MTDAIILAGGFIPELLGGKPKALAIYKDKTFIDHQIDWLSKHVDKIIIACGYGHEKIKEHLKNRTENIVFSIENIPLGTAGALKKALELVDSEFVIVCNVSDITDIDIEALKNFKTNTICVTNPRLPYGLIEIENSIEVKTFREKPLLENLWVSCGVYLLQRDIKEKLPNKGSLEKDVFPFLNLKAFKHKGEWKTFHT